MKLTLKGTPDDIEISDAINLNHGTDDEFIGQWTPDGPTLSADVGPMMVRVSSNRETRSNGSVRVLVRVRVNANIARTLGGASLAPLQVAPEAHVVFTIPSGIVQSINSASPEAATAEAIINAVRAILMAAITGSHSEMSLSRDNLVVNAAFLRRAVLGVRPLEEGDELSTRPNI